MHAADAVSAVAVAAGVRTTTAAAAPTFFSNAGAAALRREQNQSVSSTNARPNPQGGGWQTTASSNISSTVTLTRKKGRHRINEVNGSINDYEAYKQSLKSLIIKNFPQKKIVLHPPQYLPKIDHHWTLLNCICIPVMYKFVLGVRNYLKVIPWALNYRKLFHVRAQPALV